jgi:hypothetical protein
MIKVLKFLTTVSILIFLVAVLVVYAFLPDPSGLLFNSDGGSIMEVSKNTFFYSILFIFVVIQILYIVFNQTTLIRKEGSHNKKISTWIQGMILSINLFIILMIVFIGLANNAVDYSFKSIRFIAFVAPSIVILWLLALPFFLFIPRR